MRELVKSAELLMMLETERALEQHGEAHSPHEGYGLILEELDEAWAEMKNLMFWLNEVWVDVKNDETAKENAHRVKETAKRLIAEAVQVGAMAEKLKLYYESEEE